MQAQLKHPKILLEKFGRFDVRDVDVTVGVHVFEELKASIPSPFIRRLKTVFELLDETNPREQWRAIPKLRGLATSKFAGQEFNLLKQIEALFLPTSFKNFVDVQKDFRYSDCIKGREAYELPIEIIPKKMDIISRADLTLEDPAAEGVLIYKENDFQKALEQLFG